MINLFKVGVHIGMTTNSSQVLSVMLSQLTGIHVAANQLQGSLNSVRQAALAAGAVFVGWKVIDGIWHAIEGSRELNKELEKTRQLGGDFAANVDRTRAAAFQTTRDAPTSVASDNVRLAREIGSTIGRPQAAEEMLTEAAKAAHVVSHYTDEKEEDIIKNLIRTADARAQIYTVGPDGKEHVDPARLTAELNAAAKGLILGGGFIKSSDMLQEARQASTVAKAQTPEAFYAAGTEAAIAMGASKLGTAETSLMAQFVGGTMTKKVAEHLTEAGLLHDGEWKSGKSGGVVVDPKVAARFEPMMKDPIAWLSTGEGGEKVKAYAAKEGISVIAAIMQLFGRQTTQRLASEALSNEPQFARAREIYGNIPSVDAQYAELHGHDLDTNLKEVTAAWKSFTEAFSDAAIPLVIPILHGLTEAIHLLTRAAAEYPTITGGLIGLVAGLAGLTALGGALTLLNLCWAPLASGLSLLTGVTGLATMGAALGGVASGLGALAVVVAGPVAAALLALRVMKPSSTNDGEAEGLKKFHEMSDEDQRKALEPRSTFVPPAAADQKVQLQGNVNIDGKKIGTIVADGMADKMSRPSTGTNGPDLRVSPWQPGLVGGY